VPIATYNHYATSKAPGGFCQVLGHQVDFSSESLQTLYGAVGTHQDYIAKVKNSVRQMPHGLWLLPADARKSIKQPELTPFP
jgi:alpha/beta hydrolase family protein